MHYQFTTPKVFVAINGGLAGHFKERKGLRQGDPLSPYLVVLAMEAFTQLLQKRVLESWNFKFVHPKCARLQLINLCFDNDLMVFTSNEMSSVQLVEKVLDEFKALSGLEGNEQKIKIVCGDTSP